MKKQLTIVKIVNKKVYKRLQNISIKIIFKIPLIKIKFKINKKQQKLLSNKQFKYKKIFKMINNNHHKILKVQK